MFTKDRLEKLTLSTVSFNPAAAVFVPGSLFPVLPAVSPALSAVAYDEFLSVRDEVLAGLRRSPSPLSDIMSSSAAAGSGSGGAASSSGKGSAAGGSSGSALPAPPPAPPRASRRKSKVYGLVAPASGPSTVSTLTYKVNSKFLSDQQVGMVEDECKRLLPSVAAHFESFKFHLAVLLAHEGTSPDLEASELEMGFDAGGVAGNVCVGPFVEFLQANEWLRKYARTELADLAYDAAKRHGQVYPAVAKFGVAMAYRNVAFDFSDGVNPRKLSKRENTARMKVRLAALKRAPREVDVSDSVWRGVDDTGYSSH